MYVIHIIIMYINQFLYIYTIYTRNIHVQYTLPLILELKHKQYCTFDSRRMYNVTDARR